MKYIFDSNTLSTILKFYYPERFPTFWINFSELLESAAIVSVREVKFELERAFSSEAIKRLTVYNPDFFQVPSVEELTFISQVYAIPRFQQNLSSQKILEGGDCADPFIVAKAKVHEAIVVTQETKPKGGARIPNICEHFHIPCLNLEGFLTQEDWKF